MKHSLAMAVLVPTLALLSSCNVINCITKTDNTTAKKTAKSTTEQSTTTVANHQPSTIGSKQISALENALSGEWIIVGAGSTVISRDENMPYMNFVPSEHRFYGSNGCNVLNGIYSVNGDKITFSNVLTTMRYCADTDFDGLINAVVHDGVTVGAYIKKIGNENYLYLNDSNGKALLTLCRHNLGFLNGNWTVSQINGHAVDDEECNVFFDIAEMKIHGNTGCNYFNGIITMDPTEANSISFSGMGVTRMACPKGDRERLMLVALEETTTVVAGDNDDTAILMDNSGRSVLTLKRAPITRNSED